MKHQGHVAQGTIDMLLKRLDNLESDTRYLLEQESRRVGKMHEHRIRDLEQTVHTIRTEVLPGLPKSGVSPMGEDRSWLRVVRKNGARFKIRAYQLPFITLYNGDRVESA